MLQGATNGLTGLIQHRSRDCAFVPAALCGAELNGFFQFGYGIYCLLTLTTAMVATRSMHSTGNPENEFQGGGDVGDSDSSGSSIKIIRAAPGRMNGLKPRANGSQAAAQGVPAMREIDNVEDGSDDEAPDVEVASDARAREELRVATDAALQEKRKEARRAVSKAREATAIARKDKKSKQVQLQKQQGAKANSNILPLDVLERAAKAVEQKERTLNDRARKEGMSSQTGTLLVVQQERVVDGLEVVDASLNAQQRLVTRKPRQAGRAKTPAVRALNFMHKSLYGFEHHRISAVRGAAKRKGSGSRATKTTIAKRSKRGESSRRLDLAIGKHRKSS